MALRLRNWLVDPKTQSREEKEIEVSNRRAGYDICLSAPKSVSLYLTMTDDKDVEWMLRAGAHHLSDYFAVRLLARFSRR